MRSWELKDQRHFQKRHSQNKNEKRAEDIEVTVSLYSTLPDTFAGTLIAFPLFLATKARPIFAKLSSRKNQLGIPVSGQLPTYPSPNPTLTLTCYQLTVGNIGARKKNFSETILAAMIDEWTVF